jgi:hypothetical protein
MEEAFEAGAPRGYLWVGSFLEEYVGKPSRPGACCLIEGKLKDIMPFLDALSYGENVPEDVQATREEWRKVWRDSRWNRSRS